MLYKLYKLLVFLSINLTFLLLGLVISALSPLTKNGIKIKTYCSMLWARVNCRILGLRVSLKGHYNNSLCGFIVSNHISYLDIIAVGSIRPLVFVSKHEVKDWPLLGWLARMGATIFIDRSSKKAALAVLNKMEAVINQKISIVLFPEGTTSDGYVLKEFKSPLFDLPAKARIPVIPVSLRYRGIDSHPINTKSEMDSIAWYGDMKLLPHVWNVLGHKQIDLTLFFNPVINEPITGPETTGTRKLLSSLSYENIKHGLAEIEAVGVSQRNSSGFRIIL